MRSAQSSGTRTVTLHRPCARRDRDVGRPWCINMCRDCTRHRSSLSGRTAKRARARREPAIKR
jgi:hypothetical protein